MNGIIIHNHEISPFWIDRLREAKDAGAPLDVLALHPVGGKNAPDSLRGLIEQVKTPAFRDFYEQVHELGLTLEYEMHTLSWLLPRDKFATHPHWFRQNEAGERTPDANMCCSCAEALDYLEERTAYLADLLPQQGDRYFFWMDDIGGARCDCPRCRELTSSDQAMTVINRMLRGLRRVNPRAKLCYLAYIDIIAPPTSVRPEEGIFLEYAPIRRDLTRPIADASCEQNAAQAQYLRPLLDYFGTADAQVLEYWMDNSLNCRWKLPYKKLPFYPEVIAADADYYRSLGFAHLTSFGCFLGEDYAAEFGIPPVVEYSKCLGQG